MVLALLCFEYMYDMILGAWKRWDFVVCLGHFHPFNFKYSNFGTYPIQLKEVVKDLPKKIEVSISNVKGLFGKACFWSYSLCISLFD